MSVPKTSSDLEQRVTSSPFFQAISLIKLVLFDLERPNSARRGEGRIFIVGQPRPIVREWGPSAPQFCRPNEKDVNVILHCFLANSYSCLFTFARRRIKTFNVIVKVQQDCARAMYRHAMSVPSDSWPSPPNSPDVAV